MENCTIEVAAGHSNGMVVPNSGSESQRCKICFEKFDSLSEVLKHELLNHAGNKTRNSKRKPANELERIVLNVLKISKTDDEQKARDDLAEAIDDCLEGTELDVILKKYKMDEDDLICIYSRIHTCLEVELQKYGEYSIEAFGSIANGLALKSSDIDIHIASTSSHNRPNVYKTVTNMLSRSKCFSKINPIRKARVPIIKCIHQGTGFSLDINTSEPYGVFNSKFIRALNNCDPRIHQLMLFLKIWAKSVHLYGTFNMTNYCLITLVIFYLQNSEPPCLDPIKNLQRNAKEQIIGGINYGINARNIHFHSTLDVHQLIKGFFKFYSRFEFDKYIIAPYLGKAISREDFKNKTFKYPEYEAQMNMIASQDTSAKELLVDRPLCLQDMFCLNIIVGMRLSEANMEYFKKCLSAAYSKCIEPGIKQKKLYKYLLVGLVEEVSTMIPTTCLNSDVQTENPSPNGGVMSFDIIPRTAELKLLAKFTENQLGLQKLWTKEYTDAIIQIITEIFRIDMTLLSPTENTKLKKMDETEENALPLPSKWLLNCYVDLWSGRQFQRNNGATFMEYQLAQTKKLHAERRQNSNFAVQFKGYLTISVINNYNALHVEVTKNEIIVKKDPLRKFFGILKCIMQNFNLKQRIHQLEKGSKE